MDGPATFELLGTAGARVAVSSRSRDPGGLVWTPGDGGALP